MSKLIKISEITIPPDRQRRVFDAGALAELAASMTRIGLLHPIVLKRVGETHQLVAGERRLRAVEDAHSLGMLLSFEGASIPEGMIPYSLIGELTTTQLMEAELEENIRREDLTWQERAAATAALARLRALQAGEALAPVPTVADLSEEIRGSRTGAYQEATRKELILAKHLDNPTIKGAGSVDEAFKLLKKEEVRRHHEELGRQLGRSFTASTHLLLNTDALAWLCEAPAGTFDIILTDPPYGMNADSFGDSGVAASLSAHSYEDSIDYALQCYSVLAHEGFRVTKADAHLYTFCDFDRFPAIRELFTTAGWRVFRTPLIWHKPSGFRMPWPEQGPQRKYECILFAVKGAKKVTKVASDVITINSDTGDSTNAARKPVALYEDLLQRSATPGDKVLDPFCGTGPILEAATNTLCIATAIEVDTACYGQAAARLKV